MGKQSMVFEEAGDADEALQMLADGARISVKGTMSAGTFEWEFPLRAKPADWRDIAGVKHHAVLHAIRAFNLRGEPSTAMLDAIAAYEQALWLPVETMPEEGCFLAQRGDGQIELVHAWRSTIADKPVLRQVGIALFHDHERHHWVRWRPMPEAWRG